MNEELDYAEMLEIPVETITVKHKERKKRLREPDLQEQLVEQINDRMVEEAEDPSYAESTPIAREYPVKKKRDIQRIVLIGEFITACALCATIFFTNLFLSNSAINTFVRGLFNGTETAADTRGYQEFTLSPVVNEYADVELAVSETGVLSFTSKCSVYAPCAGTVTAINGTQDTGYSIELKHSDSFSTIVSGLDTVYAATGEEVKANLPLGYSDGEGEVRVMFYSEGTLLNCYTVDGENAISWS